MPRPGSVSKMALDSGLFTQVAFSLHSAQSTQLSQLFPSPLP